MAIKKLFNAFSPTEQIRTLYMFVWIQFIFNVFSLITPSFTHTAIIASMTLGIYIVLIVVRPKKIIKILKKETLTPHNATSLEAKIIGLIFTIIGSIIISYF